MSNQIKFKINLPTASDVAKYLDKQTIIEEYITDTFLKEKIIKKLKEQFTQKEVDFKMDTHKRGIKKVYFQDFFTSSDKKRFRVKDLTVKDNQLILNTDCEDREVIAVLTKEIEYRLRNIDFYALIDLSIKAEIEKHTDLVLSMTREQAFLIYG